MTEPKDIETRIREAADKYGSSFTALPASPQEKLENLEIVSAISKHYIQGVHFGLELGKEETEKLLTAPINVMGLTLNQITELIYHYTAVTGKDPKEL